MVNCTRCRKKISGYEAAYCENCLRNRANERKRNAETDYHRPCKRCNEQMINPAPNRKWCEKCKEKKMAKKKEIPITDLNISNFKYYRILQGMVSDENKLLNKNSRGGEKAGRVSGVTKLARSRAIIKIQEFINELLLSKDEYERLLGKELSLEKEYIRVAEKQDLTFAIEQTTGLPVCGEYTLAEIGEIFGLTRERVRQLQSSAEKVLKHPSAGRKLREYRGDGRDYYD